MGCCNPKYREVVNQQEEEINAKGKTDIPLSIKLLLTMIVLFTIAILVFV
ncbi:hypothetical protein [Priestia abyssalis]|nr:hypothetical protein [Priestia abyssalis]